MAVHAKKQPSGSWRVKIYSHTEKIVDPEKKRKYITLTNQDPSQAGKHQLELLAAEYRTKTLAARKKEWARGELTLGEAVDMYIEECRKKGKSPTTIREYESTREHAFPWLMKMQLKRITEEVLQDAVDSEMNRPAKTHKKETKTLSPKRVLNEYGLIRSTLKKYRPGLNYDEIILPKQTKRRPVLPLPDKIYELVHGTDIELPVLLAMWLSFTVSEIKGLTESKSISPDGDYISIREVVVSAGKETIRKDEAKNIYRNRTHRIPEKIKELIAKVDGDVIEPRSETVLLKRWKKLQADAGMNPITFHDLRHVSASVMALLQIPDIYAQERGGWAGNTIMKSVYMQTFAPERVRVDDTIDNYFNNIIQKTSA